ncbi:hypothetical protein [Pseudomonas sp. ESBL9]|uniref:hypothetical protein n=1 Tax=Pseudomonas sp. ESBL9 TaxID=3077327 RepID=UPI002FC775E1
MANDPNQDSTYRLRVEALQKVIDGIPRFKYWIAQATNEQHARQQQALAQQQADLAQEQARALALQERQQQAVAHQERQARGQ